MAWLLLWGYRVSCREFLDVDELSFGWRTHSPRSDEELKHWGRFVTEKQLVPRVPTNAWSMQARIYACHLARKHYFCGSPSIICPVPFIDILQLKNCNFQVSCGFLWLQSHYNILKCQWLDLINRWVGFVAWGGGYQQLAEDVLIWRVVSCEHNCAVHIHLKISQVPFNHKSRDLPSERQRLTWSFGETK